MGFLDEGLVRDDLVFGPFGQVDGFEGHGDRGLGRGRMIGMSE